MSIEILKVRRVKNLIYLCQAKNLIHLLFFMLLCVFSFNRLQWRRFDTKNALKLSVAWAAVHSKAVILLLLIHCLLLVPLFTGVLCLVLVLLCSRKRSGAVVE